jgi:hypothetical protein
MDNQVDDLSCNGVAQESSQPISGSVHVFACFFFKKKKKGRDFVFCLLYASFGVDVHSYNNYYDDDDSDGCIDVFNS